MAQTLTQYTLDMEIAVRSGGHNVAGTALSDAGLVIDLQLMKAVDVDPDHRRLRVQAGARLGDVDRATEPFGLALVSGINSETGLAGLTLGGGIGWLMRKYGLTIDHLVSVELVTVEGEVLQASANHHPDLFWAIRGGGGNFGIVTSFEFNLVPLGPEVYGGSVLYPAEEAGEVLRHYVEWAASAPDEVTTILMLRRNAFAWSGAELPGRPILGVGALYSEPRIGVKTFWRHCTSSAECWRAPSRSGCGLSTNRSSTRALQRGGCITGNRIMCPI